MRLSTQFQKSASLRPGHELNFRARIYRSEEELKVGKDEDDRKVKGLALLDEIVNSIPEIRQPQTRTRVKLQSANLQIGRGIEGRQRRGRQKSEGLGAPG